MDLNRKQLLEYHGGLSVKDLKVKNVDGENFLRILKVKNLLKKEIDILAEAEKSLATECEIENDGTNFKSEDFSKMKEFTDKLKAFQNSYILKSVDSNFLTEKEFKSYVVEQDTSIAATLLTYLLKG